MLNIRRQSQMAIGRGRWGQFGSRVTDVVKKKESQIPVSHLKGPKPEQVIPMEEGSFKEF